MFTYIKGTIVRKQQDHITLEQSGMGYEIYCDDLTLKKLPEIGTEAKVWIHLHLRENLLQLYGFADSEQKSLFQLLLTVSGVGPKVALSITGSLSPDRFALAILNADVKCLTGIKHVGKRMAERLVVELKDKLKADLPKTAGTDYLDAIVEEDVLGTDLVTESLAALIVLGYSRTEAVRATEVALKQLGETEVPIQIESVIKQALRNLAN